MKNYCFCLLLFGASVLPGRAQSYLSTDEFDAINRSLRYSKEYQRMAASAKGTPDMGYYAPAWIPGQLVATNGKVMRRTGLRYNIALQALEVRDSTVTQGVSLLSPPDIAGFTLGVPGRQSVHTFEAHDYSTTDGNLRGYFEPLNQTGAVRLFLLHKIVEKPAQRVESMAVEVWPARLTRETNLFVLRPGQKRLAQMGLTRAAVRKLFGKQVGQVDAYVAEHKLNLEDVDGAARAIDYYNTLPH